MQDLHELPKLRDSLSYLYVEHAILDKKQQAVEFIREDGRYHRSFQRHWLCPGSIVCREES